MKIDRMAVYRKYDGHCAYCGREIDYQYMQIDHIQPKGHKFNDRDEFINRKENLNPSCRRCNHYKRTASLETFRDMLKTLHLRTQKVYINKVAEDYGIIKVEPWDGKFYFENNAQQSAAGK